MSGLNKRSNDPVLNQQQLNLLDEYHKRANEARQRALDAYKPGPNPLDIYKPGQSALDKFAPKKKSR